MNSVAPCVLLLVAGGAVAAPAPFAKPERRTDLEKLQGEWVVASWTDAILMEWRGGSVEGWAEVSCEGRTVSVTGDRLKWRTDGAVTRGEVIRLGKGEPKAIDLTNAESRRTRRGIYRLEGDVLTLCLSAAGEAERPASFELKRGCENLLVLRRKK
jgi:uncharacterized protein (TIGR03067 family)